MSPGFAQARNQVVQHGVDLISVEFNSKRGSAKTKFTLLQTRSGLALVYESSSDIYQLASRILENNSLGGACSRMVICSRGRVRKRLKEETFPNEERGLLF